MLIQVCLASDPGYCENPMFERCHPACNSMTHMSSLKRPLEKVGLDIWLIILHWKELSDEQMSKKMTIFPTKWRANEQYRGGRALASTFIFVMKLTLCDELNILVDHPVEPMSLQTSLGLFFSNEGVGLWQGRDPISYCNHVEQPCWGSLKAPQMIEALKIWVNELHCGTHDTKGPFQAMNREPTQ